MMKSVAFFLAVFAAGVLALLVVSGDLKRWFGGGESGKERAAVSGESPRGPQRSEGARAGETEVAELNEIKVPVYDVVKGRLEYTFRGHLDEKEITNLQDIQDLESVTLRNGRLEVPIYDDIVRDIPSVEGNRKPRLFVLTFSQAEYSASFRRTPISGGPRKEREKEQVRLQGGGEEGRGTTDDGSEFRFEEIVFEIDRKPDTEGFFTIRSDKPVSIRNGYLRLESPNGLDGIVSKSKGLQKLTFSPPVRTYLDPQAARLFALESEEPGPRDFAGGEGKADVSTATVQNPGRKTGERSSKSAEAAADPKKVAITCEGPLTFLFDADPPNIRFEKNVLIYPLEGLGPDPGAPPPQPATTSFQCQLLTIDIDSKASPPMPRHAVATWEGGRVQARYLGRLIEGDRLVWTLPPRAAPAEEEGSAEKKDSEKKEPPKPRGQKLQRGEAILTGTPKLTGEEGWLEAGEIHFNLDEDRILLQKGLVGSFRTESGGPRPAVPEGKSASRGSVLPLPRSDDRAKASKVREAGKEPKEEAPQVIEKLPEKWDFRADEGEIFFAPGGSAAPGQRASQDGPGLGRKTLSRMVARALKDDGLEFKSQGDGRYRLTGKVLEYDAGRRTVSIEGSEAEPPRFRHDQDQGTARLIQLEPKAGLVALREDVVVRIKDLGSRMAKAGKKEPPAGPEDGSLGSAELLAKEMDLRFDSDQKLLGIEARGASKVGKEPVPVVLQSLPPGPIYRLKGLKVSWSQEDQVALVLGSGGQHPAPSPGGSIGGGGEPVLEFEGGKIAADSIRFDRKAWRADLLGDVSVHVQRTKEVRPARDGSGERRASVQPPGRLGDDRRVEPAPPGAGGFILTAGRAEIDFTEKFSPDEAIQCGSSRELQRVRKIHAWAPAGGAIELKSERYQGRAQEAAWNSESQDLHVFGPGRQEISILDAGRESKFTAKDIVYRCTTQTLVLTGEVKGEIRIEAQGAKALAGPRSDGEPEGAALAPRASADAEKGLSKTSSRSPSVPSVKSSSKEAAGPPAEGEVLTFLFETSRVEAKVRETENGLDLETIRGFEKVILTNERYGIQLRGDDLAYDHGMQELRIFSEEGRYQTLTHTQGPGEVKAAGGEKAASDRQAPKVDQIDSREIRLTYKLAPAATGVASSGDIERVIVKFRDDVTATFYASMKAEDFQLTEGGGPREEWKLQCDHLGIKLVPSEERERMVQLGLAEGNVIFRSGDYMATAQEAVYEESRKNGESLKKLRFRGEPQKPARLFNSAKTPPVARAAAEIVISKLGESGVGWIEQAEKPKQELPGLEELRSKPQSRSP